MKRLVTVTIFLSVLFIGAVRSDADPLIFAVHLSGPAEAPPNASPGNGFALITIDSVAHTLTIQTTFGDLVAGVTAAHIHGPTAVPFAGTAGVATQVPTFPGFPGGVTSGAYLATFNTSLASSYNPAFLNNATNGGNPLTAEATLFSAIMNGQAYFNIHSSTFPAGEIRGFTVPAPEPATMLLLGSGIGALALKYRQRRNKRNAP